MFFDSFSFIYLASLFYRGYFTVRCRPGDCTKIAISRLLKSSPKSGFSACFLIFIILIPTFRIDRKCTQSLFSLTTERLNDRTIGFEAEGDDMVQAA
jgi:hypothetical protein